MISEYITRSPAWLYRFVGYVGQVRDRRNDYLEISPVFGRVEYSNGNGQGDENVARAPPKSPLETKTAGNSGCANLWNLWSGQSHREEGR